MRSDKMSSYRCCGLFLAESITLKSKHGIQVLNETRLMIRLAARVFQPAPNRPPCRLSGRREIGRYSGLKGATFRGPRLA